MKNPTIKTLAVTAVYANPDQPRKVFDADGLRELTRIDQDLRVDVPDCGSSATLRAWHFYDCSGRTPLPRNETGRHRDDLRDSPRRSIDRSSAFAELALIENLLRRDLDVMEEARAYKAMLDGQGYTVETLAALLGHSGTQKVTGRLSLLELDPTFQDALQKGILAGTSAAEMAKLSTDGQFKLWNAIQDGKAATPPQVRRLAAAILDMERQTTMFESEANSPTQRAAADRVNRFIEKAGELLGMLTDDDLSTIRGVAKSDAPLCLDRLFLLTKEIYRVQNALAENVAKQQVMTA